MARNEEVSDELDKVYEELENKQRLSASVVNIEIIKSWLSRIRRANK